MQKVYQRLPVLVLCLLILIGGAGPVRTASSKSDSVDEPRVPGSALSNGGVRITSTDDLPTVGPDIPIHVLDNEQYLPAVAYNTEHDEYLVVWHNLWAGGGRDIYATRISGQGGIISRFAVAYNISSLPNNRAQPSVAYDSENDRYLAVWIYDASGNGTNWDVYGRFVPWDGHDDGSGEFPICDWNSSQWTPKVVYNENPSWSEFLVVWDNLPTGLTSYISGRRVFANGSGFPPGDGFTVVSDNTFTHNYVNPDVAYNLARNEYLVVYSKDQVDIWATRLEANGNVLGGGEFGIAGWPSAEKLPAVAACHTEDQYFVAWQSTQSGPPSHEDIYGRFVSGGGAPGTMFHPALRTIHERNPSVACNPEAGHYFVVWEEQYSNLSGPYGVSGRLIYTDGTFRHRGALHRHRPDPAGRSSGSPGISDRLGARPLRHQLSGHPRAVGVAGRGLSAVGGAVKRVKD